MARARWIGFVIAVAACRGGGGGAGADTDPTSSTSGGDDGADDGVASSTSEGADDSGTSTGEALDDTSSTGDLDPMCVEREDGPAADPSDCARGCEANAFDVEHLSGINYAWDLVHILSPTCDGPTCPEPLLAGTYGAEAIVPCEETADAIASPRGQEAYCRLAPIALTFGFEIGFTTPPVPDSITVERPRLDDPLETEPYVWRTGIVQIQGPATEFNGDYARGIMDEPDTVTNARNLTCMENLEALGLPYDPEDPTAACATTFADGGRTIPMRMNIDDVLRPSKGRLDGRALSCDTPQEGVDTCCNACDHELSVAVAKYGVDEAGARRSPNAGTALPCDPDDDRFATCREFLADVDRSDESQTFRYVWDDCLQEWPLPRYDKVRETHPDLRPPDVEQEGVACSDDAECLSGQECVGTDADGQACKTGAGCDERRCIAEWFVACRADPFAIAAQAYCVDTRFRDDTAPACLETTAEFEGVDGTAPAGSRLAYCDTVTDGNYTAGECCQPSLGDEDTCDPFFQAGVVPIARHDRDPAYAAEAACACVDDAPASCDDVVAASCAAPIGQGTDPAGGSDPGEYALRAVVRQGGVRYDAELDGFDLRLAATGNLGRSLPERCAQDSGLVAGRNIVDGWRAHDNLFPTLDADYDRALCSGSTYVLHFAGPDDPEHVVAQDGSTLAGKQRYVFQTSDFLVTPGSGFPSDNLLVSSCEDFALRFSNKYDLSTENQNKLAIWQIEDQAGEWVAVQHIAGGTDCDPEAIAGDVQLGAIPCLVVDVSDHAFGEISVRIDVEQYGDILQPGLRYRIVVPGLDDPADIADAAAYADAFHDACGMPLITGDLPEPEYLYDVTIDTPCM